MMVASIAAGVRLLLVARRTREIPELWIGVAVLSSALGGLLDTVSIDMFNASGTPLAFPIQVVGRAIYVLAALALYVAAWRIFHPGRPWAAIVAATGSLVSAAIWGAYVGTGQHSHAGSGRGLTIVIAWMRLVPFLWAAIECFLHHARMRRRMRIGLADPVITHQFWLWGVASSSLVGLMAVIIVSYGVFDLSPLTWTPGLVAMTLCGAVGASTIYTAFFPPAVYRGWISSRWEDAAGRVSD
jgi:hypothetical protein